MVLAALIASGIASAETPAAPTILESFGCTICHSDLETMACPAWVDIAARYHRRTNATSVIEALMKTGKHGAGPWPMPPLPEIPDAGAQVIARSILAQTR